MNIIDKKIQSHEMAISFPQDVKEYIASNCTSDIRKLEGALTRVFAYATFQGIIASIVRFKENAYEKL